MEKYHSFLVKTLIVAAVALFIVLFATSLYFTRYVLLLFFLAVVIALFLNFFVRFLTHKLPVSRGFAVAITGLFLLIVGALFFGLLLPPVIKDGADFVSSFPSYLSQFTDELNQLSRKSTFLEPLANVSEQLRLILKRGMEKADQIVTGGFNLLFKGINGIVNLIAVTVMAVYMVLSPRGHIKGIATLFGRSKQRAEDILVLLTHRIESWMLGQFTSMAIIAVIYIIAFNIIGIPHALFLGILGGLMSFVPYIGPVMGTLVPAVLALSDSPVKLVWIVIVYIFTQVLEGYLVLPLIMKERVNMPPVVTILAIVGMGELFGVMGMLLALPLTAVILGLLEQLYLNPMKERLAAEGDNDNSE